MITKMCFEFMVSPFIICTRSTDYLVSETKNLTLKNTKAPELLVKLTLVGNHDWYCEGKTKGERPDSESGKCEWNECIEL